MLSSDDPVRVFQDFATLDLLSGGRAEIMAGRGSFIESFPLFGYDLDDYDELFAEKLDLLLRLREHERVTWSGRHRPPLDDVGRVSAPAAGPAAGVGRGRRHTRSRRSAPARSGCRWRSRSSAGMPERFAPLVRALPRCRARRPATTRACRVSINSHGYIADDLAARRSTSPSAPTRRDDEQDRARARLAADARASSSTRRATLRGANFVGSPAEVIEKILFQHEIFGHDRFLVQFSVGAMPHAKIMRSIELLGTEVAPAVRTALGVSA